MKSLITEIIIDASVATVWRHLTDLEGYVDWNPFIHSAGRAVVGETLVNTMFPHDSKPQVFRPVVLEVDEHRSFRWLGHLFVSGLFDGEHYFRLEALAPNQTKLIHGENFGGLLVKPILWMVGERTKAGFEAMNVALKELAESRASGAGLG
jgi:hypothetical protein